MSGVGVEVGRDLASLAAACGQYGASSTLWEANDPDFYQVELSSSLGPFVALDRSGRCCER